MSIKWVKYTWNNGELSHTEHDVSMFQLIQMTSARLENLDRLEIQVNPLLARRPITIKAYVLADNSLLFFDGKEVYTSENELRMLLVFRHILGIKEGLNL